MNKNQHEMNVSHEEIEIDIRELLFRIRKRLFLIILVVIFGGFLGFSISKYVITPKYNSTSMIYVISKETTLTSLADLSIGSQLTEDYKVLVTSRTVMENVLKKLNLKKNYKSLVGQIKIENPRNTRILMINVEDKDPVLAKEIADAVAQSASDYIADIMEQNPPKIIEGGEVAKIQTTPNVKKNTILAMLIALMLSILMIVFELIVDDTIKTEDDIEKRFNLPIISVVPEMDTKTGKTVKKKRFFGGRL